MVHGAQDLQGNRFRQIGDQIRKIVDLHAIDCGQQLFRIHVLDQLGADLVIEFDEHIAFDVPIDQLPDDFTLRRWQRFEQIAYFRRMQRIDQAADLRHAARLQRRAQLS